MKKKLWGTVLIIILLIFIGWLICITPKLFLYFIVWLGCD